VASAKEIFELFYRCGARDFRSIGHKVIFVSNTQWVLPLISWRYAAMALRSLVPMRATKRSQRSLAPWLACGMRNSSDAGLTSHGPHSRPRWYLPSSL
jgi:hypothetical protein